MSSSSSWFRIGFVCALDWDNMEAALAAFRDGKHDVLTDFVAKYEGKELSFFGLVPGDSGASAVAKGLEENKTLRQLDVRNNSTGDDGAKTIGKALESQGSCGRITRSEMCAEPINMSLREVKGVDLEEEDLTRYSNFYKMNAWCAKVLEQNKLQGRRSQLMADFFRSVKAESLENVKRFMAMPEITMTEERKATPDILLQNAARVGLLTACKVLTTSDEFDLDKAAARKAGEGSSDPATQEYFATYGFELYLGRYRRAPEPAYESPTCSVWMAEDMKAENAQDAKCRIWVIGNNKFVLIDFDAAAEFGKPVGVKYSTSYCEPQLATVVARRQVQGEDQLQMDESELPKAEGAFDVFSLGDFIRNVHGQTTFPPHQRQHRGGGRTQTVLRLDRCVQSSLELEREDRPTLEQIKSHRFLGGKTPPPSAKVWPGFNLKEILTTGTTRMSYHFFISHMQVEAAGDVGTLSSLLRKNGALVWRDMDAEDLTEQGMCQGVRDSLVFVLFLTNGVLSRPYCLKEIWWAIKLKKPFLIVSELDERELHDKVKQRWESGSFLPYRRRNFEVAALVREMFAQAAKQGCAWGEWLPPEALPQSSDSKTQSTWPRVFVIRGGKGRAMASELCGALQERYQVKRQVGSLEGGRAATPHSG
eukprot:g66923.t1